MNTATLEDLIYGRLTGSETLAGKLAAYNDAPAVFNQTAPDDTAAGWEQRVQYPRLSYTIDYVANPERKSSGVLTMDILCSEEGTPPEEIEPVLRALLSDVFFTPDGAAPCALSWARSDAFDQERQDGRIIGTTVRFDLYAFPPQMSTDPDPVLAMNEFIARILPEAIVIGGKTPTDAVFVPTPARPAFYFRVENQSINRQTNTVAWMDCVIACHVFAGGEEVTWLQHLVHRLALIAEVEMLDTSPMFVENLKADSTLSALSSGQLRINGRYGILRKKPYVHTITDPHYHT